MTPPSKEVRKRYRDSHKEQLAEEQRAYRAKDPERYRALTRARYAANPTAKRNGIKAWIARNPDRFRTAQNAAQRVYAAIKKGLLTRPDTCTRCGLSGFIEAAHSDYTRPLDVTWLCRPCHRAWDKLEPKT
jgi:ribosomal protein S27AE